MNLKNAPLSVPQLIEEISDLKTEYAAAVERTPYKILHLPAQKGIYHGLYIEMKNDDGRASRDLKGFLSYAADLGDYCCVCYTATEAIEILREYLQLEEGEVMSLPNKSILNNGKHSVIKGKPSS